MKLGQKGVSAAAWRAGLSVASNAGDEVRIRNNCGSNRNRASRNHILVQMPKVSFDSNLSYRKILPTFINKFSYSSAFQIGFLGTLRFYEGMPGVT
jgi:hypothetical protein